MRNHSLARVGLLTLLLTTPLRAQECANAPTAWLFCDDFESGADQTGNLGLWDDQGLAPSNLVLTSDPNLVHSGKRSLEITAHKGSDNGGGPTKWFLPGVDEVYLRFWVRFAPNYSYTHHLVFLGANASNDKWAAFGTAGCRPGGSNFFATQVEPFSDFGQHPPPGAWGFYRYSMDMACDPGGSCANYANPQQICNECAQKGSPCSNGPECCWGANDKASPAATSKLGSWTCVEARVAANAGGNADGSQTLWLDDSEVGSWNGIRWRSDDDLKLNAVGLWHYVTDDSYQAGQSQQTLWFDDVVVSTTRIGCGGPTSAGGEGGVDAGHAGGGSVANAGGGVGGATVASGGATAAVGGGDGGSANGMDGCSCRFVQPNRSAAVWLASIFAVGLLRRRRPAQRKPGRVGS